MFVYDILLEGFIEVIFSETLAPHVVFQNTNVTDFLVRHVRITGN